MKISVLLLIILFISSNSIGQTEFCHPNKIKRAANKLIRKLSKEDYSSVMRISKDSAIGNQLFMAYEGIGKEIKSISKYLLTKGCNYVLTDKIEEAILEYTYFKMHNIDTCMSELLQPYLNDYFQKVERRKNNEKMDSIDGIYIPKSLEECFENLDKIYSDSIKIEIAKLTEDEYSSGNHLFGIGIWMRNNWQLWGGSKLSTYFNRKGIYHPDDMSGIIMDSYHRYLKNEEIRLDEQINYYQNYWKQINENKVQNDKWWKFKKKKN